RHYSGLLPGLTSSALRRGLPTPVTLSNRLFVCARTLLPSQSVSSGALDVRNTIPKGGFQHEIKAVSKRLGMLLAQLENTAALSVNRSNIGLMNCTGQYVTREVYLLAKLVYFNAIAMRHKTPCARLRVFLWAFLLLCSGVLPGPAFGADKWLSIHTKNFLLVGNANESDIRRVGRTLEEFRSAISMLFPKMEQTSSVPTTILVFKNDESFKPY